jgi:hypothetical protein
MYAIILEIINQPIAVDETLPYMRITQFRDDPAGFRLFRQAVTQFKKLFDDLLSMVA